MAAPGAVRLARSSLLNVAGQGLPLLAALIAIPLLVEGLGTERFGVLTLAWVLIGYFSLFDFGLGRALTQLVATHLGAGHTMAPRVSWTALLLMSVLGAIGALALAAGAPWLVRSGMNLSPALHDEALTSILLLAACIPIVIVSTGLTGILSAFQRFGTLNAIRAPMGVLAFVSPLATLPFSDRLEPVIVSLVIVRVLALVALWMMCARHLPPAEGVLTRGLGEARPLFRLGAWMTVSNIVAPLMLYLDRFLIASLISVTAVAYYATPYEMMTRLLFVSGSISAVLFPAFASGQASGRESMGPLLARGVKYVALALFPALLVLVAFAPEGLTWWLGEDFARASTPVLRVLAAGVFVNGAAQVFLALVQGVGRPDVTAMFHLVELPLYLVALGWAVQRFGIVGAAWAWTGRVVLDAALLAWFARRLAPSTRPLYGRLLGGLFAALAALGLPLAVTGIEGRAAAVALIGIAFAGVGWTMVLSEAERLAVLKRLRPAAGT